MTEKYAYSADKEVLTYVYLYKTATDSLERALREEKASLYALMSSLVFSAFALEAYLNYLGTEKVPFWEDIERIPVSGKLNILCEILGLRLKSGERPLQTITQVFKFRNWMAQGRTEYVSGSGVTEDPDINPCSNLVEAKWESFCNAEEAQSAVDDLKTRIEKLKIAAGLGEYPLLRYGSSSYTLGAVDA